MDHINVYFIVASWGLGEKPVCEWAWVTFGELYESWIFRMGGFAGLHLDLKMGDVRLIR
jgi:hypothetical protein